MNHLWQSTVFALAAGLLTLAFRRNRAQVRYAIWFAASVKFLAPFAMLMTLGRSLPAPKAKPVAPVAISIAAEEIALPFVDAPATRPASHHAVEWLPIVWGVGFATVIWIRFRGWRHVRAAVKASSPFDLGAALRVRSSPGVLEPGVVGWWRPILLLPAGIFERLTAAQLEAVLAHELCHIRRRDNLFSAIHMAVEALFWFHPLVWWIGARLVEERERACDEEVLRLGNAPHDYADAILNVCKLYVESPLVCVSGVTGADLKKRLEAILANRPGLQLTSVKRMALAMAGAVALAAPVVVGVLNAPYVRAQASVPKFEVASIKPCNPGDSGGGRSGKAGGSPAPPSPSPDRLDVGCSTVENLIQRAYSPPQTTTPISGGPSWIRSERYRIDAKAEGPQTQADLRGPMLQSLLEERFRLRVHRENKEVPIYEMTVAKGGTKFKPAAEGSCEPDPIKLRAARAAGLAPTPCGIFFGKRKDQTGIVATNTRGITLAGFAGALSQVMDRPVIDKTGIAGTFDLALEFLPDGATVPGLLRREMFAPAEGVTPEPGPSLIDALREQLGLKLEAVKGPREYLIVDRVERPSEN